MDQETLRIAGMIAPALLLAGTAGFVLASQRAFRETRRRVDLVDRCANDLGMRADSAWSPSVSRAFRGAIDDVEVTISVRPEAGPWSRGVRVDLTAFIGAAPRVPLFVGPRWLAPGGLELRAAPELGRGLFAGGDGAQVRSVLADPAFVGALRTWTEQGETADATERAVHRVLSGRALADAACLHAAITETAAIARVVAGHVTRG